MLSRSSASPRLRLGISARHQRQQRIEDCGIGGAAETAGEAGEHGLAGQPPDIEQFRMQRVVAQVAGIPNVPFWKVAASDVLSCYQSGQLGKGTHTSRPKVLPLISELP